MKINTILITVMFVMFVLMNSSCKNGKDIVRESTSVVIDESSFIFTNIPDFIALNDSMLCFNTTTQFVFSNYLNGKITNKVNINNLVSYRELISTHEKVDTSTPVFKRIHSILENAHNPDLGVLSATLCSDSTLFVTFLLYLPYISSVHGVDTGIDTKLRTYALTFNFAKNIATNIRPFDLEWDDSTQLAKHPQFGINVFNNTVYVANLTHTDYSGKILNTFDLTDLKPTEQQPNLTHRPHKNEMGMHTANFFHFQNINGKCFVDNTTKIVDLISEKEILDLHNYVTDATYIGYFTPVDNENATWFINYAFIPAPETKRNTKQQIASIAWHNIVIDTKNNKLLSNKKVDVASFCRYKNTILSIQKKENHYCYVTYDI